MDRERIDGWCEKGILSLVLGILIFATLAFGAHGPAQFVVIEAMTIGVLALWAIRLWAGLPPKLLWPPICWAVIAFVGYAIVRYLQADVEYIARQEFLRVLVYAFLFCAILNNLHRQEIMHFMVYTLLFLGMAIAFYAGYQFLSKVPYVWNVDNSMYKGRGSGTFIYPNHLAGFLEMLLPLGLCYVLMGRVGHVMKVFLGYASVVMIIGIGVTLSRGGWVATALELLVLCFVMLLQRDFRLKGLVLLSVLIVGSILVIPRVSTMRTRVEQTVMSGRIDDLRLAVWQPAYEMWQDNLWWGVGPAHFDVQFPKYRPVEIQLRPDRTHNDYLNTLVDWGIVGACLVASAWILLYWEVGSVWRTVRGARDDFSRKKSSKFALLVGASVGLFGILVHSFVDFNMHIPADAMLAVTLMALLSSQWRFATERFWFRGNLFVKCFVTLILLAGGIYLGNTGYQSARETYWLKRADRAAKPPNPPNSHAYLEALDNAFQVEPRNPDTTYAIGEYYRQQSLYGREDYVTLAHQAMEWYQKGMKLNKYDAYNWLRYGMCLDWIGTHQPGAGEDSASYYRRANELDPNGYYITVNTGWHYVQVEDYAAARTWFERSRKLEWKNADNEIAYQYLPIAERRLKEAAEQHKTP